MVIIRIIMAMKKLVAIFLFLLSILYSCSTLATSSSQIIDKNTIDNTKSNVSTISSKSANNKVCVPDDFPTIQEAIDHVKEGSIIFIKNGIYSGNIIITKDISLEGESPENVIILPDENSNSFGIKNSTDLYTKKNKISISSLQIRNFQEGIYIAYTDLISISNCIIVPPGNALFPDSLRFQGVKANISNCTIIGEIYLVSSNVIFKNNIIVNQALQYPNNKSFFIDEKSINFSSLSNNKNDNTYDFIDNIIYGEINDKIDANNIFINPNFENATNYKYLSPYTKENYGARILGQSVNEKIVDNTPPEIIFKDKIALNDLNIVTKKDYDLSFTVYDASPINKISILSEDIDVGSEFKFEQTRYKKEIKRLLLLKDGYNTINIEAIDYYGNKTSIEINLLYGESSIPKSEWNNSSIKKNNDINEFKNKIGLVIGIQKYSKDLPVLKYSENDALSVYGLLSLKGYKMFEPLLNPTLNQLKESLVKLEKLETKDDKVVIYISSHGSNQNSLFSDYSGLILTSDTNINMLSTTALPMEEFRSFIKKLEARSVVIILDMCFAGSGKGFGTVPKNEDINFITNTLKDTGKGKILLASSGDLEASYEDDDFKHGVFTYYLLEAVKNGYKSIDAIYGYIYDSITGSAKYDQRPRKVFLSDDVEGIHLLF
jgi:hypothetical protein